MKKLQKLHKAEVIILILAVLSLIFTAGYFTGKSTSPGVITVERLSDPVANTPAASDEAAAEETAAAVSAVTTQAGKLNINTATLTELESLPGIGAVIAGNIIAYRNDHGGFKAIDELLDVDGIGQKKFDALKDIITIG